ncbi:hypothetical protein ACNRWW_11370 [Metabacillus sp. HB246100]
MNKLFSISIFVLLAIILSGCNLSHSNDDVPIEMVAYSSLTDKETDLIQVSPKDSDVEKLSVNKKIRPFIDKDYNKKEVYSVIFHHSETESSGKLTVFIDIDRKTVVGKGFTDN